MEFRLVLSLIFQDTYLTAFGQKGLVSYLAVPYSLSLIKHTACTKATEGKCVDIVTPSLSGFPRSVRRITRISLCLLTGLHRTTKHDGGKKIDVPNGK